MLNPTKESKAVFGSLLWVASSSFLFFGHGNVWTLAGLCLGAILLETSARDAKVKKGVLGRLWYMFYFLAFTGLAQVVAAHGGYIEILSVIFSNLFVFVGSSAAAVIFAIIVHTEKLSKTGCSGSESPKA